jgi:type IV fimbrial biogenesis protein FimT
VLRDRGGLAATFQRGFSLTEVAITIVIIAILVATGIPSFTEWLQNAQIRTATESIMSGLQAARTEAVRRNANAVFTLTNPATVGGTGWTVSLASTGEVLRSAAAGEGSRTAIVTPTPVDAYSVTFTGLGRTPDPPNDINADGSTLLTQIDADSSVLPAAESRNLRILISAGGQMRMCDPTVAAGTDPRAC